MMTPSPRWPGLILVLAAHAAVLWGLWQQRMLPLPADVSTLFVHFIAPPDPAPTAPPPKPSPPKPRPRTIAPPQQLVSAAPVIEEHEAVAPAPPTVPAPVIESPAPPPMPLPSGPLKLSGDLAVSCPERRPPVYPPLSRRLSETGTVVLRVELDEQGRVVVANVASSSGYSRLDQAALSAVRQWRCAPPKRNGQAVRAVARQPFNFILQGT